LRDVADTSKRAILKEDACAPVVQRLFAICGCYRRFVADTTCSSNPNGKDDAERVFALLEELAEIRFLRLLERPLFQPLYGAEPVAAFAGAGGCVMSPKPPLRDLDAVPPLPPSGHSPALLPRGRPSGRRGGRGIGSLPEIPFSQDITR
jgi:hypothetical protein